ncbi:MAG: type II secretion system protein N [Gammaproteobacteria bacterium]|nr:type II secretion system protein N [Gammaproteobacteria bacterium]
MSDSRRLAGVAGYVVLAVICYLLFLVVTLPATLLATVAQRFSDGVVTLNGASGTIWHGEGEIYAGTPAASVQHLGRLHWHINPLRLFIGQAELSLKLDGAAMRGEAQLRLARKAWAVRELKATLPVHLAALLYAPASFFEPTGTIELQSNSLDLNATGLTGQAEAVWRGAGGRFVGPAGLGDYRLHINGAGENAAIQLSTERGDLQLSGQGQWHVTGDGEIRFTGSATPASDSGAKLEPALRVLGRDLGGGRRELRFNSRLPLVKQLGL